MEHVRPFVERDIPQVADLYQRVFPGNAGVPPFALRAYMAEVFFHNPWRDQALPSLVYQDNAGKIIGFLGVIPRQMVFNGQPIRMAVSNSFMVEPGRRSTLAAIELLRAFFGGSQDLSMTDGANDISRELWEKLGGTAALLYSLRWTRTLQRCRYAAYLFKEKRPRLRPFALVLGPFCRAVDAIQARIPPNRFPQNQPQVIEQDLDAETLLDGLSRWSGGESLQPVYDLSSLTWLLEMAAKKSMYGTLRKKAVCNADRELLGWWLYYLNPGGISQVLQLGAMKHTMHAVLNYLLSDAWRHGSIAISGRFQPRFLQELSENYCSLRSGSWMLVHSKDPDLLQAIYRGDAALSPLEGEGWACFLELIPA
jgi:hypothetical protein